jgi:uncharacterized protein
LFPFRRNVLAFAALLALSSPVLAGKLAIVIDDFGYRPHNENQVLAMPSAISVAVLPDSPHAREMATKAHNSGHEVLIHLPMAPLSKQPLEKNTLRPEMSSDEIERIIRSAVNNVPYAVGINNHMGSKMTSNLFGMQKVMQALERYNLYFLDSVTIGNTQAMRAAQGTGVKVIKRKVFLDDSQNEADIRVQFNRAIDLARRNGSTIAIGHPHPSTVRVLQQMVYNLPPDITLVKASSLLNEPQVDTSTPPKNAVPDAPRNPFRGVKMCKPKKPIEPVYANRFFEVLSESISQSTLIVYFQHQWQGWGNSPKRRSLTLAQCNADWCFRETGETWQSIPSDRLRSTGVLTGPDWLRMGLSSRRWTHVVWMGVYRRDVIVKNNIKFIAGLHHQDIVWTTEFMFNALRARYTEQSLYKYYLHNTSVSRLHRQGNKNLNYQRHYIKITRLLEKLNRNYADKITIYPEFHQQITYEALRVCHAVRKEPDILTRQRMIAEIFTSGMYKRLITNVRSVKVGYQALLWSFRLWQWRDKTRSHHRITRSAFNLR